MLLGLKILLPGGSVVPFDQVSVRASAFGSDEQTSGCTRVSGPTRCRGEAKVAYGLARKIVADGRIQPSDDFHGATSEVPASPALAVHSLVSRASGARR